MARRFLVWLAAVCAVFAPSLAFAQQSLPTIGILSGRSPDTDRELLKIVHNGLREVGYTEGVNVQVEYRGADGQYDRLPGMASDLINRGVAVLVTLGGEPARSAAAAATKTIPILFIGGSDPVKAGLAASFNHPGGNVSGIFTLLLDLANKQLGLLHELVPSAKQIAVLVNPDHTESRVIATDLPAGADAIGRKVTVFSVSSVAELENAFVSLRRDRADALLVTAHPFFFTHAKRLVNLAGGAGIPALYFRREFAEAGGLISYGSDPIEGYRLLGTQAGKVLQGQPPSALPIIQSTRFEMVVNLKTAKALGLTIPPLLLARADSVIE